MPPSFSTPTALRLAALASFAGKLLRHPSEASRESMLMLSKTHTVSMEKARRVLGYEPTVGLAEGMQRTEAWLREEGALAK